MRISDWSSDVALPISRARRSILRTQPAEDITAPWAARKAVGAFSCTNSGHFAVAPRQGPLRPACLLNSEHEGIGPADITAATGGGPERAWERSEEHTSELQSLMRNSYAVFCLKKKNTTESQYKNTKNDKQCTNIPYID